MTPVTDIGVLCNVDVESDPHQQLSPSVLNRAHLISTMLAPDDIRLFVYCPKDIARTGEAAGFAIEGEQWIPTRLPVPRLNANWSYRTRQLLKSGMGYRTFKRWIKERGIQVFVPYDFSELVSNKLDAYEAVREWNASLHPHTEDFNGSPEQIEAFFVRANCVFIKPRAGHKGNRIFVLRRFGRGYSLDYYDSQARRSFPCLSLEASLGLMVGAAGREAFVVQEGIEVLRHGSSVFDVRVVMINDGREWHSLFESRLSPSGSDLSNIYQGGSIRVTRELLVSVVGENDTPAVEERLTRVSHGLAEYLDSRFPGALPELGFDFVLDQDREPRLVEINAKPGIVGIGSETKWFDWTAEEQVLHERWTIPHMTHLANFLRHKTGRA